MNKLYYYLFVLYYGFCCNNNACFGQTALSPITQKPPKSFSNSIVSCKFPQQPVKCFINPCVLSQCPKTPLATCTVNRCSRCTAIWKLGKKVLTYSRDCLKVTAPPSSPTILTSIRPHTVAPTTYPTSSPTTFVCNNSTTIKVNLQSAETTNIWNWNNASNWDLNRIPQNGDLASFPTPISIATKPIFSNILTKTKTLTLSENVSTPKSQLKLGSITAYAIGIRFEQHTPVRLTFNTNGSKLTLIDACGSAPTPAPTGMVSESSDTKRTIAIIAGAIGGSVLIIVVIIAVLCVRHRRNTKNKNDQLPHQFTMADKPRALHTNPTYTPGMAINNLTQTTSTDDDTYTAMSEQQPINAEYACTPQQMDNSGSTSLKDPIDTVSENNPNPHLDIISNPVPFTSNDRNESVIESAL